MANILLTKNDLVTITNKLRVTGHAKQRLIEAGLSSYVKSIKISIRNSPLAWEQDNGQIVVTLDEFSYFVIYRSGSYYTVVSYIRKSINNYTAIDKFIFEYRGKFKDWNKDKKEQ